jgi:hypothetical protein
VSALNRPCPRCGGSGELPASVTTTDQDAISAELTRDAWDRLLRERDELRAALNDVATSVAEINQSARFGADRVRQTMDRYLARQRERFGSDEEPRLGGPPIWPETAG